MKVNRNHSLNRHEDNDATTTTTTTENVQFSSSSSTTTNLHDDASFISHDDHSRKSNTLFKCTLYKYQFSRSKILYVDCIAPLVVDENESDETIMKRNEKWFDVRFAKIIKGQVYYCPSSNSSSSRCENNMNHTTVPTIRSNMMTNQVHNNDHSDLLNESKEELTPPLLSESIQLLCQSLWYDEENYKLYLYNNDDAPSIHENGDNENMNEKQSKFVDLVEMNLQCQFQGRVLMKMNTQCEKLLLNDHSSILVFRNRTILNHPFIRKSFTEVHLTDQQLSHIDNDDNCMNSKCSKTVMTHQNTTEIDYTNTTLHEKVDISSVHKDEFSNTLFQQNSIQISCCDTTIHTINSQQETENIITSSPASEPSSVIDKKKEKNNKMDTIISEFIHKVLYWKDDINHHNHHKDNTMNQYDNMYHQNDEKTESISSKKKKDKKKKKENKKKDKKDKKEEKKQKEKLTKEEKKDKQEEKKQKKLEKANKEKKSQKKRNKKQVILNHIRMYSK
ncbi:hypothetical protein C9374_004257 [Naegleria lovaniensis]|uniref:Uncharacterized protein n=1 Tax=Naegleria lovaniensis TaxID=51637 RepID=A0AA88KPC8_NAELO|nr:uncharacterized protein C9374_004257 [Naegleria lovaniensis]KAG2383586.1 hypothetical protein C9374_004257 [Naegleria lovaniensis]